MLICLQIAFLSLLPLKRFDNDVSDGGTNPLHRGIVRVILVVGTLGQSNKTEIMAIQRDILTVAARIWDSASDAEAMIYDVVESNLAFATAQGVASFGSEAR